MAQLPQETCVAKKEFPNTDPDPANPADQQAYYAPAENPPPQPRTPQIDLSGTIPSPTVSSAAHLPSYLRPFQIINSWGHLNLNIAIVGGWYPVAVIAVIGFLSAIRSIGSRVDLYSLLVTPFGLLLFAAMAFGVGLVYAGIVAAVLLSVIRATLHTLNWQPGWPARGLFCGGMVAYLCLLPMGWFEFAQELQGDRTWYFWSWSLPLFFILAVFLGQIGGGKAGIEVEQDLAENPQNSEKPFRFSIWQLLSVTLVLSLVLTGLRLAGLLNTTMLLATAMWLVAHFLLKHPALFFSKRWVLRSQRKRKLDYENRIREHQAQEQHLAEWLETREQEQRESDA